jgi:hypothetical protein
MKPIVVLVATVLAVACTHGVGSKAGGSGGTQTAQDETALAEALTGRVAGEPQDCIRAAELAGNQTFGRGVILFRSRTNDVLYVNRPPGGCAGLDFGRAIKIQAPSTRLCRGDLITVFDPLTGAQYGSCGLGAFTPYRRAY